MKTYFIHTFGCQANKSDSQRVAGDYQARGYHEAPRWQVADEIIINTCSIRQRAEDRVVGLLLNIEGYFKQNNLQKPKIILTGCMTHHGENKLRELLPQIDEILPINEVGFNQSAVRKDKTHAWIPISQGCNSFCTFCIVPYSRGREVSRSKESILEEIQRLVEQGYSEVTLLGQNVNSWGLEKAGIGYRKLLMSQEAFTLGDIPSNESQYFKPDGTLPFVDLLKAISSFKEIKKISFMTSNPWDFYDDLIEEIATNPKIDRFVHLPVQSGSDNVLRLMNRGYTSKNYLELIDRLRAKVPDVEIGTDIIVGFPGETEEDFNQTVELAKKANWKVAFVAQYSPRPGTAAWRIYKDEITPQEKRRRFDVLEELINKPHLDHRPHVPK
jgi:tRNA-2-methylthio-N6-dimethylallyladenosine synthase